MKIALGTAQFGFEYGISNRTGITTIDEVGKILNAASQCGVDLIDTARVYANSESIIGRFLPQMDFGYHVVTKLEKSLLIDFHGDDVVGSFSRSFDASLKALAAQSVYGLLTHSTEDLLGPHGQVCFDWMSQLKLDGKVKKIGVSVYDVEEAKDILDRYDIDIIQLPLNILDQRFTESGMLKLLKSMGVEIHARSVFLQGLLLMDKADIPEYFRPIMPTLQKFNEAVKLSGYTKLQACLGFVKNIPEIDRLILGFNTASQFFECCDAYQVNCDLDFKSFSCDQENFIKPSLWECV